MATSRDLAPGRLNRRVFGRWVPRPHGSVVTRSNASGALKVEIRCLPVNG